MSFATPRTPVQSCSGSSWTVEIPGAAETARCKLAFAEVCGAGCCPQLDDASTWRSTICMIVIISSITTININHLYHGLKWTSSMRPMSYV